MLQGVGTVEQIARPAARLWVIYPHINILVLELQLMNVLHRGNDRRSVEPRHRCERASGRSIVHGIHIDNCNCAEAAVELVKEGRGKLRRGGGGGVAKEGEIACGSQTGWDEVPCAACVVDGI